MLNKWESIKDQRPHWDVSTRQIINVHWSDHNSTWHSRDKLTWMHTWCMTLPVCTLLFLKPSSGAEQAAGRQRERSGHAEKPTPAQRCPLSSSPLRSSAGASSLLGLIKPTDPLLLIDFFIINSVCLSISLRLRISPSHAKVLCNLPPSGYQRANIDSSD